MTDPVIFTREQLYELVWSKPISKIGPEFEVSDVAIAKICRKLDVPRPPRGYWAKLAHGKSVRKTPLPKLKKGGETEYVLNPGLYSSSQPTKPKREIPSVTVKERVTRYHPVVAELRSVLKKGGKDKYHRIATRPSTRFLISKEALPRASRIMDALLRELNKRGFKASFEDRRVMVLIEGEKIKFEMLEPAKRDAEPTVSEWGYKHWDFTPTGNLSIELWCWYLNKFQTKWSDTPSKRLEDRLGQIIALFEEAPSIIRAKKEDERLEELASQRRQLRRRRLSDVIIFTHERASQVDQLIEDLQKAKAVRSWVAEVRNSDSPPAATTRLTRWASEYADHLDPLVDFRLVDLDTEVNEQKFGWNY